jgi:ATP-binding cassette subfamily B protein
MPQRTPFSRAWSFLNFKPVAKWSALVAAAGTGILYVGLLLVLFLFADLVVGQGHIPAFADLPSGQHDNFPAAWSRIPREERAQRLKDLKTSDELAKKLAADEIHSNPPPADQELQWRAYVLQHLSEYVGPQAADVYRERAPPGSARTGYVGMLATVVATRDNWLLHSTVSALARWNPWLWRSDEPLTYLTALLGFAIVLILLRQLLMFANGFAAALASIEAVTRMRRAVYHHTFRLGTLAIKALGPSEAVSMFTRHVEAVHDALVAFLTGLIREPVQFALLVLFALAINFWLAVTFLIFAALVWLVGGLVASYFRQQGDKATRAAAGQLALLQESLSMMRLVKVYLMELFNQARVERQLAAYAQSLRSRATGEAIYRPLLGFLAVLAAVVLLYVAGISVLDGRLAVSGGIVLVTALISLYWPLENFLEQVRVFRRGRESAAAVFKFLDRPGDVGQVAGADFLPPLAQLLEFDNVSLREPGTTRMLLRGVSLTIQAGQRVALVGSDDAEKHALVYLIPRFLDPSTGEIRIDAHNLRWVTLDSLRAQTAIVLQHNLTFNDTVANNIGCGDPAYTLPQIIEAAKVAHAHHFIQKLPKGYDTPIGELGHGLNVGEQFRIALARAVLRDPALVIIEEPVASALDEDTRSVLDDTFTRMLPGRTVIFLPHRISTLRGCKKVFLLHKGKIEAAGEHRELLQQSELYQHLYYLEFNIFAGQI